MFKKILPVLALLVIVLTACAPAVTSVELTSVTSTPTPSFALTPGVIPTCSGVNDPGMCVKATGTGPAVEAQIVIATPTLIARPFDLVLVEAQNLEYIRKGQLVPPAPFSQTVYAEVPWKFSEVTKDTRDTSECPDWTESERVYARFAGEGIVEAEHLADGIHIFSQAYGELGTVPEGSIWRIVYQHESLVYLNCQNRFFFLWRYQP